MNNSNLPLYLQDEDSSTESITVPSESNSNLPLYLQDEDSSIKSNNTLPLYLQDEDSKIIQPNIDKPTNAQLAQYGASLETYLIGDMLRLGEAAFTSKTAKQIEKERMEAIYEKFPWAKSGEYDNNAYVWGGRGLVMVSDPVYLLMPWARAAQAGRAYKGWKKYTAAGGATAALGAGVGVGASSIHVGAKEGRMLTKEEALLAGGAGAILSPIALGVTAGISKVAGKVAPNLFSKDKITQEGVKKLLAENQIKSLNLSAKQLADIKKISNIPSVQKLFRELTAQDNNYIKYVLPRENIIKLINKFKGTITTKEYKKIYAKLSPEEKKLLSGTKVKDLKGNIKDLNKLKIEYGRQAHKAIENQAKAESRYNLEVVKQVHAIGGLKSQLGRALAYNFTRPFIGAGMGAGVGTLYGETEEEFYSYLRGGLVLGFMSRSLRAGALKGIPLKEQQGFAKLLSGNYIQNLLRKINIGLSTSTSTRLSARGGIVDEFSTMMFPKFDTSVRLNMRGQVIEGQGARLTGYSNNVETSSALAMQKWTSAIFNKEEGVLRDTSLKTQDEALKIVRGAKGKFSTEAQELAVRIKDFLGSFKFYYNQVGIKEAEVIANYFPRKIDFNIVNSSPESKKAFMKDMSQVFINMTRNASKKNPIRVGTKSDGTPIVVTSPIKTISEAKRYADNYFKAQAKNLEQSIISSADDVGTQKIILPLSEHINKERILQGSYDDVEKVMEKWLVNDVGVVLHDLARTSVRSVEFARKFGPEANLLSGYFKRLNEQYTKQGGVKSIDELSPNLSRELQLDKQSIVDATNAIFNRYGTKGSQTQRNIVATLSTLGNLTMMDKVTIANIGDLVQPFQNSRHFLSWIQGIKRTSALTSKEKGGAEALGLMDDKIATQLIKDSAIVGESTLGTSTKYIDTLSRSNQSFFKWVGLEGITNLSRRYAFNVGIVDGFKSARAVALKVKESGGTSIKDLKNIDKVLFEDLKHLSNLGINNFDDIVRLGSFKNLDDALVANETRSILNKIGLRTAERDAIIPTVGNRLLFTQTRSPWIRLIGQFSSWAQAKSSQTNALIAKAESGEQAQLIKMTAALVAYGAIANLREFAKYGEVRTNTSDQDEWYSHALNLSGNLGWLPTLVINKSVGPGSRNTLDFFPGTNIATNIIKTAQEAIRYRFFGREESYDEMVKSFYKTLPLPTIRAILYRMGLKRAIYEEPFDWEKATSPSARTEATTRFSKGGQVTELKKRLQQRNK